MNIIFDIGGTKTRIARVCDDGDAFDEPIIFKTPPSGEEGIAALVEAAQTLARGERIAAAVGGIAGVAVGDTRTLFRSPHLPGWEGKQLGTMLREALGCEHVAIENDGEMVGLGEAHAGAGDGYPIVAYITISTGVGGGRIVDGRIDRRAVGSEPGHQIIDFDRTLCRECSDSGCFEDFVSGSGVKRRRGCEPYEVPQDDPLWEELSLWSAVGLKNTIVHWSPDVLVLGGSMIVGDPAIPINRIKAHLVDMLKIFPAVPDIKKAELGALGGLHGALAYMQYTHIG